MITDKTTAQHYRLTLEDAIAQYKKRWITATALLHYYLKIRLKVGWKTTLHHKEIHKLLGIPKTSFYRAISALAQEGFITWEAPNGIVVKLVNPLVSSTDTSPGFDLPEIPTDGTEIPTDGTEIPTDGTEIPTDGTETPLKPIQDKASSNPSDSYQIFISSLSSDQREKFKAFCKRQADRLPKPVVMFDRWIACHYLELWQQYKQAYPDQPIAASKDKSSAAPVTKLKEKLDQLISTGKLQAKQNLINIGYVVLSNGDADPIQNWIAT